MDSDVGVTVLHVSMEFVIQTLEVVSVKVDGLEICVKQVYSDLKAGVMLYTHCTFIMHSNLQKCRNRIHWILYVNYNALCEE